MPQRIDPQLRTIKDYFSYVLKDHYFVVPAYQREYSWEINQCEKLYEDIETFILSKGKDPYFFGTIIADCSNDINNEYNLIDGQQRTTTFLLLLKALLIHLNNSIDDMVDDQESIGLKDGLSARRNEIIKILYKVQDEDIQAVLKDFSLIKDSKIFENRSINENYPDEVIKILNSYDFNDAESKVTKIPKKQRDNRYTSHFKNFKFFYETLNEKSPSKLNLFSKILLDECQVIEIRSWKIEQAIAMFNSLNSKGLPLSDSDIISAQLYSNADQRREEFKDEWKKLINLTTKLESRKIVDIDSVLQQYMYINRALDREYVSEKDDGSLSVDVTTPGLRRYYTDLNRELMKNSMLMATNLNKIADNWDTVKDFPIVKLLLKFNENAKLYLSSYMYRFNTEELSEKKVEVICENLLKLFALLEISNTVYSSNKFKTFLFEKNIDLVDIQYSDDKISKDFDSHINENWDRDNVINEILGYEGNILVFLNDYLYSKAKNKDFNFKENVNIEHIMPASGRNISTIRDDANLGNDEFKSLVNSIGNKILLEADINKSIGNNWFRTKKQTYINQKSGYKDSDFALAESLTSYPSDLWTKEDIEKATQKAANRIADFIFSS